MSNRAQLEWNHDAAIVRLTSDARGLLRALLDVWEAWPAGEGPPPFVGCEVLRIYDAATDYTAAERVCFRMTLDFIATQLVEGIERRPDPHRGDLVRLTAEGVRHVREKLATWEANARRVKRRQMAATVDRCEALALELDPPATPATGELLAACRNIVGNARALGKMMDDLAAAGEVDPEEDAPWLAELVAVNDKGPVYAGDVWHDALEETARDAETIRARLEPTDSPALAAYSAACLDLATVLGEVRVRRYDHKARA